MARPRKNTAVKYIGPSDAFDHPFKQEQEFVFLTDILNMPGACVVVGYNDGRVHCGYPSKDFVELTPEEMGLPSPVGTVVKEQTAAVGGEVKDA